MDNFVESRSARNIISVKSVFLCTETVSLWMVKKRIKLFLIEHIICDCYTYDLMQLIVWGKEIKRQEPLCLLVLKLSMNLDNHVS